MDINNQKLLRVSYSTLISYINNGCISYPSYQREYVWNEHQQQGLLKSFVENRLIPCIVLSEVKCKDGTNIAIDGTEYNYRVKYEVTDGQQRLETLKKFYREEIGFVQGTNVLYFPSKYQDCFKYYFDEKNTSILWNRLVNIHIYYTDRRDERISTFQSLQNTTPMSLNDYIRSLKDNAQVYSDICSLAKIFKDYKEQIDQSKNYDLIYNIFCYTEKKNTTFIYHLLNMIDIKSPSNINTIKTHIEDCLNILAECKYKADKELFFKLYIYKCETNRDIKKYLTEQACTFNVIRNRQDLSYLINKIGSITTLKKFNDCNDDELYKKFMTHYLNEYYSIAKSNVDSKLFHEIRRAMIAYLENLPHVYSYIL